MIVLDTTVLVYAVGVEHPLREPCRALVAAIASGAVVATTTAEVIQEFCHVRARRRDRADAVARARDYVALLDPLLPIDAAALAVGLRLFEETPGIGAFDACLCAAAIGAGAEAIVSADAAFATVTGVRHVDPGSEAFLPWLAQLSARPG